MRQYNIHEAKTQFSAILERVEAGEEIVITRSGRPVARIVPVREHRQPRVLGQHARRPFMIAADFDELPADTGWRRFPSEDRRSGRRVWQGRREEEYPRYLTSA